MGAKETSTRCVEHSVLLSGLDMEPLDNNSKKKYKCLVAKQNDF